jgi:rod shape-determining protein MreD
MKYFIYLIAIIVILGLNLGIFNSLQLYGQIPNLLFLFMLFFALEKQEYDFFFIALLSGLFLDFYSAGFFGAYTFAFLAVGLSAHLFANNLLVLEIDWKSLSLLLLISLIFFNLLLWVYQFLAFKLSWSGQYVNFNVFTSQFLVSFIYNWLLLYPMYLLFTFLRSFIQNLSVRRRGVVR